MKTTIYLLLLTSVIAVSCTGKQQSETAKTNEDSVSLISLEQQLGQADEPLAKFKLLNQIAKVKAKTLSADEFSNYFLDFKTQLESLITQINANEEEYLYQRYGLHHDDSGNEITPPDWVQEKEKSYADAGLQFKHIGEGQVMIHPADDYYSKNFDSFLTPEIKDYLKLKENDGKIVSDGGLWVEAKELADEILKYERFIANHPHSKLLNEVKEQYHFYQNIYLTGIDNWPRMNSQCRLNPDAKTELQRFVKAYPDSKTAELAKVVLSEKENDRYILNQWIEEQQK